MDEQPLDISYYEGVIAHADKNGHDRVHWTTAEVRKLVHEIHRLRGTEPVSHDGEETYRE